MIYLRIPEIQRVFCQAISGKIPESIENTKSVLLKNWNSELFDKLQLDKYLMNENQSILKLAQLKNWQSFVLKHKRFFFNFLTDLIDHVATKWGKIETIWEEIPYYDLLILTFFDKLKSKPIEKCSEIMLSTSLSILRNPKMINKLITILIRKIKFKDHNLDKLETNSLFNFLNTIIICAFFSAR